MMSTSAFNTAGQNPAFQEALQVHIDSLSLQEQDAF